MIIGIVGGGQLGMMMTDAAHKLGLTVYVLDSNPNCSCKVNADRLIVKPYDDIDSLADLCDVITFEFENVSIEALNKHLDKVPQGTKALYITTNRIREKENAKAMGLKTPRFARVLNDLEEKIKDIGYPAILKTASEGYDGHGQYLINNESDLENLKNINIECILEEKINFDYEISCIVSRSLNGDVVTFPIPKNIHKHGILFMSIVDNNLDKGLCDKAKKISKEFVIKNDFFGDIAIEFFVKDNELYFNEFAPRPHNSGHYTIEGCAENQFDTAIKSVLGLPLGNTELIENTLMVNVLGQDMGLDIFKESPNKFIHMYHKDVAKENRKMGHITYLGFNQETINYINEHINRN